MSFREFDLAGFAKLFHEAASEHRLHEARKLALEYAAETITAEAKSVIGSYSYDWPQLTDATQADRERKGFPANEPLLRTGAMRDSISWEILDPGKTAIVGSTDEVALWQELGTDRIPPRPFLMPTVFYLQKPIEEKLAEIVGMTIFGNSVERELIKVLIEAAKHAAESAKELSGYNRASEEMDRKR
jgi:hypothetical protein